MFIKVVVMISMLKKVTLIWLKTVILLEAKIILIEVAYFLFIRVSSECFNFAKWRSVNLKKMSLYTEELHSTTNKEEDAAYKNINCTLYTKYVYNHFTSVKQE